MRSIGPVEKVCSERIRRAFFLKGRERTNQRLLLISAKLLDKIRGGSLFLKCRGKSCMYRRFRGDARVLQPRLQADDALRSQATHEAEGNGHPEAFPGG